MSVETTKAIVTSSCVPRNISQTMHGVLSGLPDCGRAARAVMKGGTSASMVRSVAVESAIPPTNARVVQKRECSPVCTPMPAMNLIVLIARAIFCSAQMAHTCIETVKTTALFPLVQI